MKKGLTLIELMIVIIMFVVLTGVTMYILRAILLSWASQETRTGIDISLDRGIEEITRDLRKARQANYTHNGELRFTLDLTNYHIYYLYNANDSYPPSFNQSLYQLRKAGLSAGMNGTFTYGSGDIKITDVLPPPVSNLSLSSNLIILDLSVAGKSETIRSRTQVRPRNL